MDYDLISAPSNAIFLPPLLLRPFDAAHRINPIAGRAIDRLDRTAPDSGMDEIPVVAETGSEFEARLWEIAENLHRAELTTLERAEHISQWIRLRNQTAESQPRDQADNKLGQVGPVSEPDKVAQMAQVRARGGTRSRRRPSCRRP